MHTYQLYIEQIDKRLKVDKKTCSKAANTDVHNGNKEEQDKT
jgi:hypothetical protein